MSFYSSNKLDKYPGVIGGNPTKGICERVCIQVPKVFDACMSQMEQEDVTIAVTNFDPVGPVLPLTYISCSGSQDFANITNLVVNRFKDKPNFARVTCDIEIPLTVTYTDANGVEGTGTSTYTVTKDCILFVPQESIIPYSFNAFGALASTKGRFVRTNLFVIDCCIYVMLRVVVNAELLVPSYGYCPIPPCQEYTADQCNAFFNIPLYPSQCPLENSGERR